MNRNWTKVIKSTSGGGRSAGKPKCTIYMNGAVVMNAALYEMIGSPTTVNVFMEYARQEIKLVSSETGFVVSGGGGTQARFTLKAEVDKNNEIVGPYFPIGMDDSDGGVILGRDLSDGGNDNED